MRRSPIQPNPAEPQLCGREPSLWEKRTTKKKVHYNLKNRPTLLADKLKHPQNRAGGKGVVGNLFQLVSCFRPEPTTTRLACGSLLCVLAPRTPFLFSLVHAMFRMTLAEEWYALKVLFSSRLDFVDHDMGSTLQFPGSVRRIMARPPPSSWACVTGASKMIQ